jgi:hypothetical protein
MVLNCTLQTLGCSLLALRFALYALHFTLYAQSFALYALCFELKTHLISENTGFVASMVRETGYIRTLHQIHFT